MAWWDDVWTGVTDFVDGVGDWVAEAVENPIVEAVAEFIPGGSAILDTTKGIVKTLKPEEEVLPVKSRMRERYDTATAKLLQKVEV